MRPVRVYYHDEANVQLRDIGFIGDQLIVIGQEETNRIAVINLKGDLSGVIGIDYDFSVHHIQKETF